MKQMKNQPTHQERAAYAIIGGLHFLAFIIIGSTVSSDTWRGICALGAVLFLMVTMLFPAEAMDQARAEEDDENRK